jgi:hypothetical protein
MGPAYGAVRPQHAMLQLEWHMQRTRAEYCRINPAAILGQDEQLPPTFRRAGQLAKKP